MGLLQKNNIDNLLGRFRLLHLSRIHFTEESGLMKYFHTMKYLKMRQIYYRLFFFFRNRFRVLLGFQYRLTKEASSTQLVLPYIINGYSAYRNGCFYILNQTKVFEKGIDWNYSEYGKLWTYNLNYFEYLHGKNHILLIYDFIHHIESIEDGLEPFPISLRGINWIKFLTRHDIKDKYIDDSLYAQYGILIDNLEYHLLGNHLLENGFSLLFGAYYFKDEQFYGKAKEILSCELQEQILDDGGHFELSPMYHQLMLYRVLDCINLVKHNDWKKQDFLGLLIPCAEIMLGWLNEISYKDGGIPLFNDSAERIAPTSSELLFYAKDLEIKARKVHLGDSGYRCIRTDSYECIVDVGKIGAEYIPGHAHADTFNFELRIQDSPFVVDGGTSTYENNSYRATERGTSSHNTVEVLKENSSEVWSAFRVADRAKVIELEANENHIKATHDGYRKKFGILHTREWRFKKNKVVIEDTLNKESEAIARIHFHPDISEEQIKAKVATNGSSYTIEEYNYASEFNKRVRSLVMIIPFKKDLRVEIDI